MLTAASLRKAIVFVILGRQEFPNAAFLKSIVSVVLGLAMVQKRYMVMV